MVSRQQFLGNVLLALLCSESQDYVIEIINDLRKSQSAEVWLDKDRRWELVTPFKGEVNRCLDGKWCRISDFMNMNEWLYSEFSQNQSRFYCEAIDLTHPVNWPKPSEDEVVIPFADECGPTRDETRYRVREVLVNVERQGKVFPKLTDVYSLLWFHTYGNALDSHVDRFRTCLDYLSCCALYEGEDNEALVRHSIALLCELNNRQVRRNRTGTLIKPKDMVKCLRRKLRPQLTDPLK